MGNFMGFKDLLDLFQVILLDQL